MPSASLPVPGSITPVAHICLLSDLSLQPSSTAISSMKFSLRPPIPVPLYPTLYQTWSSCPLELLPHWLSTFLKLFPLSPWFIYLTSFLPQFSEKTAFTCTLCQYSSPLSLELQAIIWFHNHSVNSIEVYPVHLHHLLHEFQISTNHPIHSHTPECCYNLIELSFSSYSRPLPSMTLRFSIQVFSYSS